MDEKKDISQHKFLVISVNDSLHWYITIIWNLQEFRSSLELLREQTSNESSNILADSPGPTPNQFVSINEVNPHMITIAILYSLHRQHDDTIRNLRKFLIQDLFQKHGFHAHPGMFNVKHVKNGIPEQPKDNAYDCGLYACWYVKELMGDPESFGEKLTHRFDQEHDWDSADNASLLRVQVRSMLQELGNSIGIKDAKTNKK